MQAHTASATTHGKAILIGEHSVVYDKTALALPIQNLTVTATINYYDGKASIIESESIGLNAHISTIEQDHPGLFYLLTKFKTTAPFHISYQSNIPTERGLGSSAAISLATIKVLNQFLELNLTQEQLLAEANHAEELNHGSASGLDIATVSRDDLVYFDHGQCLTIHEKLGGYLVIADSGVLGNTKKAVTLVREKWQASSHGKAQINQLTQLVAKTKSLWQNHNVAELGRVFNQAQASLRELGISNPTLENLIKVANENGSLGSKLSGGGLGGIIISLTHTQEAAQKIAAALKSANAKNTWIEEI